MLLCMAAMADTMFFSLASVEAPIRVLGRGAFGEVFLVRTASRQQFFPKGQEARQDAQATLSD